jgi:hypothetical protein
LPELIEARLESEREFRRLECLAAIGEAAPGLEKARKASENARAALHETSLRLGGFRRVRGDLGPDLCKAHDSLKLEIPEHVRRMVDNFTSEWHKASAAFAILLGRRAAIEQALGVKMELSEPVAVAIGVDELGDMGQPYEQLERIHAALKVIDRMQSALQAPQNARAYTLPGTSLPIYDPNQVYVLTKNDGFMGYQYKAKLVDASLERGRLEALVLGGDVKPVYEMAEFSVTAAASKVRQIERDEQEQRERFEQAEALRRSGLPQPSRRPDLEKLNTPPDDSVRNALKEKQLQMSGHHDIGGGVLVGSRP